MDDHPPCWQISRFIYSSSSTKKNTKDDTKNLDILGGGNSNVFYFHPDPWGRFPFDDHIFQMGWFNHQLQLGTTDVESFNHRCRKPLCHVGSPREIAGPNSRPDLRESNGFS